MSRFLSNIEKAKQAAEAMQSIARETKEPVAPVKIVTTDGQLYEWTRGKEVIVSAAKPGFGFKQGAAVDPAPSPAPTPTPTPKPEPEPTKAKSYWIDRTNGNFAEADKKPGFVWRPATPEEIELFLDAMAKPDEPSPAQEATSPEHEGYSLSNIVEAFKSARFTQAEAEEEAQAIQELVDQEPALATVMAESPVPLNAKQLLAAYYAKIGKSFVLTGAAGTGKTTAQAATIDILDKEAAFATHDFKYIGTKPSIAIVAFTKVAVRNIQKAIRKNERIAHYADHCMTIHSLLEFEPVVEERRDDDGTLFNVRIFRPQRHAGNPLTITHLVIEEASMVGLDLFKLLADALLPGVQIIYLGDINQLQPVFSKPILGYALVKLPVIELTRVYRQALDNPIIFNAHQVLIGNPIKTSKCGLVSVVSGESKVQTGQSKMAMAIKNSLKKLYEAGFYDPEEDQVLLPWNKQFLGTKSINEAIASFLGAARKALVYQVKAGRTTWWLAEGDKVLVDKRVGIITSIQENPKYIGAATVPPGMYTRTGIPLLVEADAVDFDATTPTEAIDYSNFDMGKVEVEETARAASHIIRVQWVDTDGAEGLLSTSGDFADSKFDFAYAMTVHKAQGSEWRKVFVACHQEHLGFLCRELMYTALTRAREEFIIFAKAELIAAACKKQDIKGNSLQDKIEYFLGGALGDLDMVEVEFPTLEQINARIATGETA